MVTDDLTNVISRLKIAQSLLRDALQVQGELQKQWYLERIGQELGVDLSGTPHVKGVPP